MQKWDESIFKKLIAIGLVIYPIPAMWIATRFEGSNTGFWVGMGLAVLWVITMAWLGRQIEKDERER